VVKPPNRLFSDQMEVKIRAFSILCIFEHGISRQVVWQVPRDELLHLERFLWNSTFKLFAQSRFKIRYGINLI
jgi:hypothetical protein